MKISRDQFVFLDGPSVGAIFGLLPIAEYDAADAHHDGAASCNERGETEPLQPCGSRRAETRNVRVAHRPSARRPCRNRTGPSEKWSPYRIEPMRSSQPPDEIRAGGLLSSDDRVS